FPLPPLPPRSGYCSPPRVRHRHWLCPLAAHHRLGRHLGRVRRARGGDSKRAAEAVRAVGEGRGAAAAACEPKGGGEAEGRGAREGGAGFEDEEWDFGGLGEGER